MVRIFHHCDNDDEKTTFREQALYHLPFTIYHNAHACAFSNSCKKEPDPRRHKHSKRSRHLTGYHTVYALCLTQVLHADSRLSLVPSILDTEHGYLLLLFSSLLHKHEILHIVGRLRCCAIIGPNVKLTGWLSRWLVDWIIELRS